MGLTQQVLKSSLIVTGGNYLAYGVNIMAQLWLIRLLSPSEFGQYAIILVTVEILYVFLMLEFATACICHMEDEQIFHTAIVFAAAWVVLLIVVLWVLGIFVLNFVSKDVWQYSSILVVLKAIYGIGAIYGAYLEKDMKFGFLTVGRSISKILGLTVGIGMAMNEFGVVSLIAIDAVNYILSAIITIALSPLRLKISLVRGDYFLTVIKNGFSQFKFRLSGVLLYKSPVILVQSLTGDAALVGIVDRAMYVAMLFNAITAAFTTKIALIYFKRATEMQGGVKKKLNMMLWLITRGALPMLLVFLYYPNVVVRWIYGDGWDLVTPYIQGFSAFSVLVVVYNLVNQLYMAANRLYIVTAVQMIMGLLFLISMLSIRQLDYGFDYLSWAWSVMYFIAVMVLMKLKAIESYIENGLKIVAIPLVIVTALFLIYDGNYFLKENNVLLILASMFIIASIDLVYNRHYVSGVINEINSAIKGSRWK